MQVEYINIDTIKGAEYNPRVISDKQFETLVNSIQEIGLVIPIIVNRQNNTIIAGHQRTRAARAAGLDAVPCFFCDNITIGDEIRFNQLHNFTDSRDCRPAITVEHNGFQTVSVDHLTFPRDNKSTELSETCRLLSVYGNLLCAVTCAGKVIVGGRYALACKLIGLPVNIYNIDDRLYNAAIRYLTDEYGVFSYDKLKRNTYVQGLAQLARSANGKNPKRQNVSKLYANCVLPYIADHPDASVLDFGCGKGAYIKSIQRRGRVTVGVEFYNHNYKSILIDKGNAQIDTLIETIKQRGLFDVVVCDSVLNSVDCIEAYDAVLMCLNIFTKDKVFVSGRPIDAIEQRERSQRTGTIKWNKGVFLDENNFTGVYRAGSWYYQQYSSEKQIVQHLDNAGLRADVIHWGKSSFQIECTKIRELANKEKIAAIKYEFSLPLPNGKRYERANDVLGALDINQQGGNDNGDN